MEVADVLVVVVADLDPESAFSRHIGEQVESSIPAGCERNELRQLLLVQ